eukprot:364787-Chlamydomonas_euryale.AAC.24
MLQRRCCVRSRRRTVSTQLSSCRGSCPTGAITRVLPSCFSGGVSPGRSAAFACVVATATPSVNKAAMVASAGRMDGALRPSCDREQPNMPCVMPGHPCASQLPWCRSLR